MRNDPLHDAALAYAARGWTIIPVRPGTKRAACRWARYQTERPGEAALKRWFGSGQKYPAVILGPASGGLLCRDFDVHGAYDAWAGCHADLAESLPTVRTARGRRAC